jgi:Domain of unknown function (DUF4268)
MSLREQEYQKFWRGFNAYMSKHYSQYGQRAPSKNNRQIVPPDWFGGYVRIAAGINRPKDNVMQVDITLHNRRSKELTKEWYRLLLAEKDLIEKEMGREEGTKWAWRERDGPESHIILYRHAAPEETHWGEQYAWLSERVDKFHKIFGSRITALHS